MAKRDDMGHARPVLDTSKQAIHRWVKCPVCHETKKRGEKWHRPCPGPAPEKRYMGG